MKNEELCEYFVRIKYSNGDITESCYGTKECESCNCKGNVKKCDFYPEKHNQKVEEFDNKAVADCIKKFCKLNEKCHLYDINIECIATSNTYFQMELFNKSYRQCYKYYYKAFDNKNLNFLDQAEKDIESFINIYKEN